MTEVILSLGSNMEGRENHLRRAIYAISNRMILVGLSSVYETEPMFYDGQGWFLNCVAVARTKMGPATLHNWLKGVEKKLGRAPNSKSSPRPIDIDILFYGTEIISTRGLRIPYPGMAERAFDLIPLNEIRPNLVHPVLKVTIKELATKLPSERVIKRPDLLSDLSRRRLRPKLVFTNDTSMQMESRECLFNEESRE